MLLAAAPSTEWLQVLQVVAISAIGAWVMIQKNRVTASTAALRADFAREKKRCTALERRVKVLEGQQRPAKPKSRKR